LGNQRLKELMQGLFEGILEASLIEVTALFDM
jgi:hypothetical protein